jgi:hypothetical protein
MISRCEDDEIDWEGENVNTIIRKNEKIDFRYKIRRNSTKLLSDLCNIALHIFKKRQRIDNMRKINFNGIH